MQRVPKSFRLPEKLTKMIVQLVKAKPTTFRNETQVVEIALEQLFTKELGNGKQ